MYCGLKLEIELLTAPKFVNAALIDWTPQTPKSAEPDGTVAGRENASKYISVLGAICSTADGLFL